MDWKIYGTDASKFVHEPCIVDKKMTFLVNVKRKEQWIPPELPGNTDFLCVCWNIGWEGYL